MYENHPSQSSNRWQRLFPLRSRLERLAFTLLLAGLSIVGIQLLLYATTGVLQTLLAAGGVALATVLAARAYALAQRQQDEAAGIRLIAAVFVAYLGGELAFSGTTGFFIIGGLLVIALVSLTAFPRRWRTWLIISSAYLLSLLLINWLEPLPRHNARDLATLTIQIPIATILVALFVLWQIIRAMRGISTIRTRLLIAFVGVALLPALIVIVGVLVGGHTSGRHRMQAQLESVAALKEAEVQTWIDDLQSDLILALTGDEVSRRLIVLLQERDPSLYPIGYSVLQTRFKQVVQEPGRFESLFLMDLEGQVIVSTDQMMEGQNHAQEAYFQQGLHEPGVQPPAYDATMGRRMIVASRPVYNSQREVIGVLAGRANLDTLNEIMGERAGLGETGETYLVDSDYTLLTDNRFGEKNIKVDTYGARDAIEHQHNGSGIYNNYRDVPVVGAYHWLPTLQVALLAEQSQAEAFRNVYAMLGIVTGVGLLAVLLAIGVSLIVARSIATPLAELAKTATQIAAGDLERTAPVQGEDEIATLALAFNSMTAQLRGMIGRLEERVTERTQELERRSRYLEATTEVMRTAATVLDLELLMQQVVDDIRQQFDLYYVGLFLVDEQGQWAVLQAGTGEAGRALLDRGHRHRVGEGMIGWCIAHAEPRVARQVEQDTVHQTTPELPETRWEAALPLRSRGRVLGALTVQHTSAIEFDQEAILVLQALADQVAAAIDNARLFAERQQALEAVQRAYGELSSQAWRRILQMQPNLGFRSSEEGISRAENLWRPEMEQALRLGRTVQGREPAGERRYTLAVPIRVRGQVIGVLDTCKPAEAGEWTEDEIALMEAIADQLDAALESARLYQETQRRAAREFAIRRVTEQMRRAVDVEAILQNTVTELAAALGVPRAYVRLGTEEELLG